LVTLDKSLKTTPSAVDFAVTKTVTTATAVTTTVTPTAATSNGAVITLTVPVVAPAVTGQSVVYNVAYGTTTKAAVAYTVAALPTFAVKSVTALNANQIAVEFVAAVDKTTAETLSNYTVKDATSASLLAGTQVGDATKLTAGAALQADGKTVVLTLQQEYAPTAGQSTQQKAFTVTASGVKDLALVNTIADYSGTATVFDTALPTLTKVNQISPTTFDLVFSEPVTAFNTGAGASSLASALKLNNGAYSISAKTHVDDVTIANNVIRMTTGATLAVGAYTLTVNGTLTLSGNEIKDYAGFMVPATTYALNVVTDTTAVTASVTKVDGKVITLTFNKKVTDSDAANTNVVYRLDYNNTSIEATGSVKSADGMSVAVTFANPIPVGAHTLYVHYKAVTAADTIIKDTYLNAFAAESAVAFTVIADTTAPTAKVTFDATVNNNITVTFSKAVVGADAPASYTLTKSDGTVVAINLAVAASTANTYTLTPASSLVGTYTLAIVAGAIKDTTIAQNYALANSYAITAVDVAKPTVASVTYGGPNGMSIYVNYNKPMTTSGAGSILDKANYQYNGVALPTCTITLGGSGNTAVITLTTLVTSGQTVTVGRVADASGNYISAFATTLTLGSLSNVSDANLNLLYGGTGANQLAGDKLVSGTLGKVTSTTTVDVYVDKQLSGVDVSKIIINSAQPSTVNYTNMTLTDGAGNSIAGAKVTFTVLNKFTSTAPDMGTAAGNGLKLEAGAFTTVNGTLTNSVNGSGATTGVNTALSATAIKNTNATTYDLFSDAIVPIIATNATTTVADVLVSDAGTWTPGTPWVLGGSPDGEIDTVAIVMTEPMALPVAAQFSTPNYDVKTVALSNGNKTITLGITKKTTVTTNLGTNDLPVITMVNLADLQGNTVASTTATAPNDTQAAIVTVAAQPVIPGNNVTFSVSEPGTVYVIPAATAAMVGVGTNTNATNKVTLDGLVTAGTAVKTTVVAKSATATAATLASAADAAAYRLAFIDGNGNVTEVLTGAGTNVVMDKTAATVTTKIAAPVSVTANGSHTLVFSEALSTASKAAVKAAVDAAYTKNGTSTATSAWNGAGDTLTVTITAGVAPNNAVLGTIAPMTVTDVAGNASATTLILQN
jgi:hypothetical protein